MIYDHSHPGLPDPFTQAEFYADVPLKRLLAWVVDTILILLLAILFLPFTAFTALFFFPLFYVTIGFVYRAASITRWSATPGMLLFAIELRTSEGDRFDTPYAVLHTLGYTVSLSFVLPQVVSVFLMLTTPRAQGLTDLVLQTAAINRPRS